MSSGDKVDFTWTVLNGGTGDASGSWVDHVTLRPVGGTGSVIYLGSFTYSLTVQAGKSYSRTEQLAILDSIG